MSIRYHDPAGTLVSYEAIGGHYVIQSRHGGPGASITHIPEYIAVSAEEWPLAQFLIECGVPAELPVSQYLHQRGIESVRPGGGSTALAPWIDVDSDQSVTSAPTAPPSPSRTRERVAHAVPSFASLRIIEPEYEAIDWTPDAVQLDSPQAHLDRGWARLHNGELVAAAADAAFASSQAVDSDEANDALFLQAVALRAAGELQSAIRTFEDLAVRNRGDDIRVGYIDCFVASCYSDLGDIDAALKTLGHARCIFADCGWTSAVVRCLIDESACLELLGRCEEAQLCFQTIEAHFDEEPTSIVVETLVRWAELLGNRGSTIFDVTEAIELAERAQTLAAERDDDYSLSIANDTLTQLRTAAG